MNKTIKRFLSCLGFLLPFLFINPEPSARAQGASFIRRFNEVNQVASTVPANGDVNPYGVALVRRSVGSLVRGNILVSNFNNSSNQQGTGTTIVQVTPDGSSSVFAQITSADVPSCPGGVGLTTALVALRRGWVVVGSLPTTDGTSATAQAGCLIVVNSNGQAVETIQGDPINGPWDMTAFDAGDWAALFVTNVLNGTVSAGGSVVNQGTVVRVVLSLEEPDNGRQADEDNDSLEMPSVVSKTIIGSDFSERTDPDALVIGPTGVGFGRGGALYVADTLNNRIQAIPDALSRTTSAGTGDTVFSGGALNGPLGLAIAPGGRIITVNGGDGNMVEIAPDGVQAAVKAVDTTGIGGGTLFGLAIAQGNKGVYLVNDGDNTLKILQ